MRDEDIDLSDNPELTPEMFARAVARRGLQPVRRKQQITLHLDADVPEWFRAQGSGYQSKLNQPTSTRSARAGDALTPGL